MNKKPFFTDAVVQGDFIRYWVRDYTGELLSLTANKEDYLYCFQPVNDGKDHQYVDMYGNPVKKVCFESSWQMHEQTTTRDDFLEADVQPLTRFMIDEFSDADVDSPIRAAMYDIEVDFDLKEGNGYPVPENPFGEVNSIQIFDVEQNEFIMMIPEKLKGTVKLEPDPETPIVYLWCRDEVDMLECFSEYLMEIDVIGGWYTNGFDLPYLMERAIILFGETRAKKLFCRDGIPAKKREFKDDNGRDCVEWTLFGVQHIDLMELYKKFNPQQLESFSLDSVCEHEGVGQKIPYTGDLGELYRTNPNKFYEYAVHDVRLLRNLNRKTDILKMTTLIARTSCVKMSEVTGSVKPIENSFMKFCRDKGNIVLPTKRGVEKEKFPGAIVYDTLSGRHGWSFSIDLGSLYPSCMIMLGLSNETIVMQLMGEYDDYVEVMTQSDSDVSIMIEETGEVFTTEAKNVYDIIREDGLTISANGTIFNGKLGLLSEFTQGGFNRRAEYKAMMKNAKDDMERKKYDLYQKVEKTKNNSIYGCTSNIHFRLYDIRLAKSITLTGQVVSKFQAAQLQKEMDGLV